MDNNLIKKVKFILNKLDPCSDESKISNLNLSKSGKKKILQKRLKLWNMDTSILTIVEKFLNKVKAIKNPKFLNNQILVKEIIIDGDKRYYFSFNDHNITPSKDKKEYVAKSTKDQYIKVLSYFDLIILLDYNNTFGFKESKLKFNYHFINFYFESNIDNWLSFERILDFVLKGFTSDTVECKKMALSFLVCLIYQLDESLIFFKSNITQLDNTQFIKNKDIKGECNNDKSPIEKIKKLNKETYGRMVEKLISEIKIIFTKTTANLLENKYAILEYFIDQLIQKLKILYPNENFFHIEELSDSTTKEFIEEINFETKVANARSKLRKNILAVRNKKNDLHYSDITTIDPSIEFVHDAIEQQEAAHIVSVEKIKRSGKNLKQILKELEDPNNGILMDHTYHDAFDKKWLSLDMDGNFHATPEWNIRYYDSKNKTHIKYPLMKIKEEVFNIEMLKYIKQMENN